ncbi:MAG: glutathione S-transferase family protein [Sphingomonadaceae bacterium]|nr:glutathione S-transferase family protein [Sphingomonadaceae bacterium]
MTELILHEYAASRNCYKIRLALAHIGRSYERREYDILKGETRTPRFLATVNANGRIPVLQVGSNFLPESNAALWFLAEGTDLLPDGAFGRADVLRWLFWEQYNHEPNIATLRFWRTYGGGFDEQSPARQATIPDKQAAGEAALKLMDDHLAGRAWFVGDRLSIADIALYAYTHVAADGGFALEPYRHLRAWLERVAAQPGHVTITG